MQKKRFSTLGTEHSIRTNRRTYTSMLLFIILCSIAIPFAVLAAPVKVDIVGNDGKSIKTPSVTFGQHLFSFNSITTTGRLGTTDGTGQIVRITVPKNTTAWTISLAATNGPGSLWTDGVYFYDYNDPSGATDGSDGDSQGGQLTWLGGGSYVGTPAGNCPTTNLVIAPATSYVEGTINSINILYTLNSGANKNCEWDYASFTDNLSQIIPATQPAGTYSLPMMLTVL